MGLRRQAREAALQALFACDFLAQWSPETGEFVFEHFGVPPSVREFAIVLVRNVIDRRQDIDARITCASENWSISRMSRVDRNLLRLGACELMFLPDVPVSVAINEAIEIAKRFGTDESPNFVNGVLDRLAGAVRGEAEEAPPAAAEEQAETDAEPARIRIAR